MKIFMNKTAVFLQLKSEIIYKNNKSNVKLWANNSIGVLWWWQIRWNLLSNHTSQNEVIFFSLNIWNWSQLEGINKIVVYTVTHDLVASHHFLLLEADGQNNLKYKRLVDRGLAGAFQASYSWEAFQLFIYQLKLQEATITSRKSNGSSIQQRAAPCLYLVLFPPLYFNGLSLSKLQNVFVFFFSLMLWNGF